MSRYWWGLLPSKSLSSPKSWYGSSGGYRRGLKDLVASEASRHNMKGDIKRVLLARC